MGRADHARELRAATQIRCLLTRSCCIRPTIRSAGSQPRFDPFMKIRSPISDATGGNPHVARPASTVAPIFKATRCDPEHDRGVFLANQGVEIFGGLPAQGTGRLIGPADGGIRSLRRMHSFRSGSMVAIQRTQIFPRTTVNVRDATARKMVGWRPGWVPPWDA